MLSHYSYAENIERFFHRRTFPEQAHAAVDCAGFVGWLGQFVHRSGRRREFRILVRFVGACLFLLAALVVLPSGGCLALVAISTRTIENIFPNRRPCGGLFTHHCRQPVGLSDLHAVAATAA